MKYPRSKAAAAVHQGKIIVSGGRCCGREILSSVECLDPESGVWTELTQLPCRLCDHSLVSYGNQLILMGGCTQNLKITDSVLKLSPLEENGRWKKLSPMEYGRAGVSGVTVEGEVFVFGGGGKSRPALRRVEIFDGKEWRDGPALPFKCSSPFSLIIHQHLANLLCFCKCI